MRELGPVRFRFDGDVAVAKQRIGIARTQLGIMKNLMQLGNLQQSSRKVQMEDGTVLRMQSVPGQDIVTITVPEEAVAAVEEIKEEAVSANRVVDYVGVAMPNPVPYRGLYIGVVAKQWSVVTVRTGGVPGVAYPVTETYTLYINGVAVQTHNGSLPTSSTYVDWGSGGIGNPQPPAPADAYFPLFTGSAISGSTPGTWSDPFAVAIETAQAGPKTYIMTSDGTVLASEVQNTVSGHTYYVPDTSWNGEGYCNMYVDAVTPPINHQLTFTVPEDAVYPAPATSSSMFKARRKAWFLKNSTEFIAALKGGFKPGATGVTRAELQTGKIPANWDYKIKTSCYASLKTYQPILMNASYADIVTSDTSAGLTQAGTMVTKRTVIFNYVDAGGVFQQKIIDGYLTQVVTVSTQSGGATVFWHKNTYGNWYSPNSIPREGRIFPIPNTQFLQDGTFGQFTMLLWDGVEFTSDVYGGGNIWTIDSTYGTTGLSLGSALGALGYIPAQPPYSNNLVGTVPDFILQYHNAVQPKYHLETPSSTHDGNTAWNNSALHSVKQIELCLFGPAPGGIPLGLFADPSDADGATQIAYYGEASLQFNWTTGKITPMGAAIRDTPSIIPLPTGYSYKNQSGVLYFNDGVSNYTQAYNCAIGYVWDSPDKMWPDVAEYLRAKIAQLKAGQGDQVLYTVIRQALSL